ncbi:helix-turn-helix domain-containing protein [Clostridium lacusfryxellense]|uniref:helix-turn-helix domain-containing protein n=1 Tax=Clostridium lacusfryxellense TaxID=205328 RepID=UPI001C0D2459|nr:helix-turn-helix domain-containing protein [Clostridium lacusfryxellense]MBU3110605.1 helix-turn-helix domain-containing protein [Clostridium lacusfryxellense]
MSRVGDRIKQVREAKSISQKQLGKKIGVSEGFINEVELGRKVINEKFLEKISKILGEEIEDTSVSFHADDAQEESKPKFERPNTGKVNEVWNDAFSSVLKDVSIYKYDLAKAIGIRQMPIISNKVEGYAQDKVLFLKIENDDMLGFRICSGDIAFAHLTHEIENNSISLVDYNGERLLRQIKTLDSNKVLLISNRISIKTVAVPHNDIKVIAKLDRVEFKL